ncbi:DASH complex subunit Dad3-domain-containing protein [Alternaria alternata]|nr:DASH complex subunit Dad3-domain-containing protein [Alternaria alternata]
MASEAAAAGEQNFGASQMSDGEETLTPLEQEVLDEYARLLGNLNTLSSLLLDLSNNPSAAMLDGLRGLERKTSLVFTLLKASVYSIVLNQQIDTEGGSNAGDDNTELRD